MIPGCIFSFVFVVGWRKANESFSLDKARGVSGSMA
jgi:hypothetical protein